MNIYLRVYSRDTNYLTSVRVRKEDGGEILHSFANFGPDFHRFR